MVHVVRVKHVGTTCRTVQCAVLVSSDWCVVREVALPELLAQVQTMACGTDSEQIKMCSLNKLLLLRGIHGHTRGNPACMKSRCYARLPAVVYFSLLCQLLYCSTDQLEGASDSTDAVSGDARSLIAGPCNVDTDGQ